MAEQRDKVIGIKEPGKQNTGLME
jgi:hypothetical protein